jgi:hypothetical protein
MRPFRRTHLLWVLYLVPVLAFLGVAAAPALLARTGDGKSDGPGFTKNPFPHKRGDARAGQNVFRFETFGNEGFWTNAMRLPQGMKAAKFTPLDALKAGLHVDSERVPPRCGAPSHRN